MSVHHWFEAKLINPLVPDVRYNGRLLITLEKKTGSCIKISSLFFLNNGPYDYTFHYCARRIMSVIKIESFGFDVYYKMSKNIVTAS